jgi:Ion channel
VGAITDVRITRWIPFATKPSAQVVVGCVISIALSIESVYLLGMMTGEPSMAVVLFAIISMLLSYIVPTAVVVLALYRAFQRHLARKTQIRAVVSSYFCTIVVFTGVFFSMQFLGDHEYAIDHYGYYRSGGESLQQGRIKKLNPYPENLFAFNGINAQLWGTVDDFLPRGIYMGLEDAEQYRADWAMRADFESIVRFKRRAIRPVLSDCFHLSVITMTTVGYGNISPNTWYAKLATDVEALTGTVLLVVAFGMLLAGFRERDAE